MIIQIENNLDRLSSTLYSFTGNNISAGGTTIPVKNINSFRNLYAIQIGKTGEEQAEVLIVSGTPSGTSVNTSGTIRFDHPIDTPIYSIHYDQIIIKRSTTGTAGSAISLSGGTINITPDSLYTNYNDEYGSASYAYKTQFYNSLSSDVSSESDWFTPGGPSFYSLSKIRERVRSRLYNSSYIKDDSIIDDWINEWLEEMNTAAVKVNKDYLLGSTSIAFGTSGLGTVTASDFMYPRKIEITTDGVNFVKSTKINVNEYDRNDTFSSNAPRHSWEGDTIVRFLPTGVAGTAEMIYSKGEAVLEDETDELPYPMRRYSRSFVNYALHCAYENDQKMDLSETNYSKAQKVKNDFINEISPRDQTGPQFIEMNDSLTGLQDDVTLATDYFI